jgi:hypothetical protein
MNKSIFVTLLASSALISGQSQDKKIPRYFDEPIWTDSTSTLFLPVRYNEGLTSNYKIALWGNYYANMVVYNFKQDTHKRLFDKDTFIISLFSSKSYVDYQSVNNSITENWVFLLVKQRDYNENGRVDEKDPSVLYAVTRKGENLQAITDSTENVVSFRIFEKQGFALLRMQRDYFRKISLKDLSLGKPIEIN